MERTFLVNCKRCSYEIYIGRPSIYGNPWGHEADSIAQFRVATRAEAIQNYRDWLYGNRFQDVLQDQRIGIIESLDQLRDKILGCWCSPLPCHGEVLIEFVKFRYSFEDTACQDP